MDILLLHKIYILYFSSELDVKKGPTLWVVAGFFNTKLDFCLLHSASIMLEERNTQLSRFSNNKEVMTKYGNRYGLSKTLTP